VALEIDRLVADLLPRLAEHAEARRFWKDGLRRVDGLCRREHGAAFVRASPRQRLAVVTGIARGELDPQAPEEHFFVMLKAATARAYYSSQLGIQKDLGYQGNSYLEEFVGHDPDEPL
jgi:hypothetical protein